MPTRLAAPLALALVAVAWLPAARAAGGRGCTIVGTAGADRLRGTIGADVICARGGDDQIRGLRGSDVVFAGRGDDSVRANRGADVVQGGHGHDTVMGGHGDDDLRGGDGSDYLEGEAGRDILLGGRDAEGCLHAEDGRRDRGSGGPGRDAYRIDGRDEIGSVEVLFPTCPAVSTPPPGP
jgi:Ca2+-binding RTX toxin-like protein